MGIRLLPIRHHGLAGSSRDAETLDAGQESRLPCPSDGLARQTSQEPVGRACCHPWAVSFLEELTHHGPPKRRWGPHGVAV